MCIRLFQPSLVLVTLLKEGTALSRAHPNYLYTSVLNLIHFRVVPPPPTLPLYSKSSFLRVHTPPSLPPSLPLFPPSLPQRMEHKGIKFWCYNAGHVLGAAMFMIEIGGLRVLYTGDYSMEDDR